MFVGDKTPGFQSDLFLSGAENSVFFSDSSINAPYLSKEEKTLLESIKYFYTNHPHHLFIFSENDYKNLESIIEKDYLLRQMNKKPLDYLASPVKLSHFKGTLIFCNLEKCIEKDYPNQAFKSVMAPFTSASLTVMETDQNLERYTKINETFHRIFAHCPDHRGSALQFIEELKGVFAHPSYLEEKGEWMLLKGLMGLTLIEDKINDEKIKEMIADCKATFAKLMN